MAVSYVFYPFKLPSSSRGRACHFNYDFRSNPLGDAFFKASLLACHGDAVSFFVRYHIREVLSDLFLIEPAAPRYIHQFREPPTVRAALASEVSQTFEYMEPLRHGTVQMSRRQLAPWQTKPREERNRPPCTKRKNWCFYSCKIKPSCIAEGGILSIFARKTGI